jgi:translocation and assembly module TamA
MHRRAGVLGLLVTLAGCAGNQPKPEGPMIDSLRIEGTAAIPPREVKKKILTSQSSLFPVWLQWLPLVGEDEFFDVNAWQADLRRIERYYQAEGYYQAKVLDDDVVQTKPGHVALNVKVKEGEPTRITEINLVGLDGLEAAHQAKVKDKLPVKVGEIFREVDWSEAKAAIANRLQELGYAEAIVEGEAIVDLEKGTAVLSFGTTPGIRYRFGTIFVANDPNAQVPPKWIVEQVENAIRTGDWYSESALNEAQGLVFQMGVFGAVKVNRGAPDRAQQTVPVVVDVREAPFRSARLGPGIGVDSLRQEIRLIGEYTHRNFLGGLRRFSVRGKLGYAFLPAFWDPKAQSGPVATITTEFSQPRFLNARNLTGTLQLDLLSGLEPAYRYVGGTFKAGVVWRPWSTVTVFPSYNLDVFLLGAEVPLGAQAPEAVLGCPVVCVISYLEQTVEWDRRDSKLEPKSGTFVGLSLQEGGLGGVFTFLRAQPEVRGYLSFGEEKKVTLAAKLKVGTLHSFNKDNETPIIARFFSGGSAMRGFSTRRLSPLLEVPVRNAAPIMPEPPPVAQQVISGETIPIGGKGLLEASVELRWNVWGDLVLALFSDTGMVPWESLGESANPFQYVYTAVGFGARYRTPLGPIRVDLAVRLPLGNPARLNPQGKTDPRTIDYPRGGCFGLGDTPATWGGHPEGICAFHLSIGESF